MELSVEVTVAVDGGTRVRAEAGGAAMATPDSPTETHRAMTLHMPSSRTKDMTTTITTGEAPGMARPGPRHAAPRSDPGMTASAQFAAPAASNSPEVPAVRLEITLMLAGGTVVASASATPSHAVTGRQPNASASRCPNCQ